MRIELTGIHKGEIVRGEFLCAFERAAIIMTDDGSLPIPAENIRAERLILTEEEKENDYRHSISG